MSMIDVMMLYEFLIMRKYKWPAGLHLGQRYSGYWSCLSSKERGRRNSLLSHPVFLHFPDQDKPSRTQATNTQAVSLLAWTSLNEPPVNDWFTVTATIQPFSVCYPLSSCSFSAPLEMTCHSNDIWFVLFYQRLMRILLTWIWLNSMMAVKMNKAMYVWFDFSPTQTTGRWRLWSQSFWTKAWRLLRIYRPYLKRNQ